MGWNYLSIPKCQRLHRWRLGMDKWFHNFHVCNYLSMLGLTVNHVTKLRPGKQSKTHISRDILFTSRSLIQCFRLCLLLHMTKSISCTVILWFTPCDTITHENHKWNIMLGTAKSNRHIAIQAATRGSSRVISYCHFVLVNVQAAGSESFVNSRCMT